MKRKQVYRVTFTHFANYHFLVEAESREKAKEIAADSDGFSFSDPSEQWEKVTKVVCLGTAEKTKPRRANPYRHGCNPSIIKFGGK